MWHFIPQENIHIQWTWTFFLVAISNFSFTIPHCFWGLWNELKLQHGQHRTNLSGIASSAANSVPRDISKVLSIPELPFTCSSISVITPSNVSVMGGDMLEDPEPCDWYKYPGYTWQPCPYIFLNACMCSIRWWAPEGGIYIVYIWHLRRSVPLEEKKILLQSPLLAPWKNKGMWYQY